eukprot:CAMPEP_0179285348 /NCGR_PEP_ID=MMETSP0797-20121207/39162_1 /TAXON_ID=47934 /ORGANISM="Dinophysis acuminata, Strain DAEP01" /LENGTH=99 /DNA_ID=CAMNT_0020994163 /DNA_START=97 /DNA_END=392 /DNA_ORIENTATION=-
MLGSIESRRRLRARPGRQKGCASQFEPMGLDFVVPGFAALRFTSKHGARRVWATSSFELVRASATSSRFKPPSHGSEEFDDRSSVSCADSHASAGGAPP